MTEKKLSQAAIIQHILDILIYCAEDCKEIKPCVNTIYCSFFSISHLMYLYVISFLHGVVFIVIEVHHSARFKLPSHAWKPGMHVIQCYYL